MEEPFGFLAEPLKTLFNEIAEKGITTSLSQDNLNILKLLFQDSKENTELLNTLLHPSRIGVRGRVPAPKALTPEFVDSNNPVQTFMMYFRPEIQECLASGRRHLNQQAVEKVILGRRQGASPSDAKNLFSFLPEDVKRLTASFFGADDLPVKWRSLVRNSEQQSLTLCFKHILPPR